MSRSSIVLVVIALGLLGFIWFFERGSLSTTERELRKGRVLESFVRDRVTRLELQRRGVTTVLVKVPPKPNDPLDLGGWQVEAPYKAKADSTEVDELLGSLEWAEARRSLGSASAKDVQQFGLDAPRYRVRYVAGREEGGFSVGAPAADGGGAYLQQKGSDTVYVVGSELLDALQHEPEDFHAKNLHEGLTVLTTERIELSGGERGARKIAKKAGFFWLEQPIAALASSSEVKALVDALDALHASRYVGEQLKPEYGLTEPRLSVDLDSLVYDSAHKGERHTERFSLRAGATCGTHTEESYIQVGQSSVYCAANSELSKLERSPEALRETRVMPLDDDAISGVVLRDNERELSLSTADDVTKYRLTQFDKADKGGKELKSGVADADALKRWYNALRELHFSSIQPQGDALELTGMQATFTRSSKDDAPYTLHIDAAKLQATRLTEASLLELPAAALPLLSPLAARYRAKRLLDEDESQLVAISVSGAGTPVERIEKRGADYQVVAPQSTTAARAPRDELSRLFSKLEVVSFESDTPRAAQGLASPYRVLKVEYKAAASSGNAQSRTHTLKIGAKANDQGYYAQLDDDSTVFIVSNAIVSKIEGSLVAP